MTAVPWATATVAVFCPGTVAVTAAAVYLDVKHEQANDTAGALRLNPYNEAKAAKSNRARSSSSRASKSETSRLAFTTTVAVPALSVTVLTVVRVAAIVLQERIIRLLSLYGSAPKIQETYTVGVVVMVTVGVLMAIFTADLQKGAAYDGRINMSQAMASFAHVVARSSCWTAAAFVRPASTDRAATKLILGCIFYVYYLKNCGKEMQRMIMETSRKRNE